MHEPVLLWEVINNLHIKSQAKYIDATLGGGGHTLEILKKGGNVLGIDADPKLFAIATSRIEEACTACPGFFKGIIGNFRDIDRISKDNNFTQVSGILFDLGISTIHYQDDDRGFSFQREEDELDMRLNAEVQAVKASDLLNSLREDQLKEMFLEYLDYGEAVFLAKQIVEFRKTNKLKTVGDFLKICKVLKKRGKVHPATRAFMALRIYVNTELDNISIALPKALGVLENGGILAVITFHSTEDRLVKKLFQGFEKDNFGEVISKNAIKPSSDEISKNAASRSAKLRLFRKKN